MSRKTALALLSAGVLVAALLTPTAALADGRPCADITGGGGDYAPSPVPLDNDGTLTGFRIWLAGSACASLTYTMYVMDEASDLTPSSKGDPVFKEGVSPLAELAPQMSGSDAFGPFLEYAEPNDVQIADPDGPEQDNTICVFHTVTNAAGHVFDYGTPDGALCKILPDDDHAGATAYR